MTADVTWPTLTFIPRTVQADLMGETVGGGRSLTGKMMPVSSDSGYWKITLGNIPVRRSAGILAWRTIARKLQGRLGTCLVPFYEGKRAPWPGAVPGATITAKAHDAIAVGATSGHIDMIAGNDPEPGMFFSTGERGYELVTATVSSGDHWSVTFRPPAREAISANAALEFANPVCRCRLVADDGMALALDLQSFAFATVDFEEDV